MGNELGMKNKEYRPSSAGRRERQRHNLLKHRRVSQGNPQDRCVVHMGALHTTTITRRNDHTHHKTGENTDHSGGRILL